MILKSLFFLAPAFLSLAQLAPAAEVVADFSSASSVPVNAVSFTAAGNTVNLALNFAPPTGTYLTVVNNTGLAFINGTFDNLAQGQKVGLPYGGITYEFIANYYGGSGNDLVLIWANHRTFAWGFNLSGQLGDNTTTDRSEPVAVNTAAGLSALSGKTVMEIAEGGGHSLALCSDGTVAAWGTNGEGRLGDGTTTHRSVPVAVNTAAGVSALSGKKVVALAAGYAHSLALCSDGTVVAWGYNSYGQLGDGTTLNRFVPVAVNTAAGVSALSGKTVVAVAAGNFHSLALCSDGTVAAWGNNDSGRLGDNTTTNRSVPVAVNTAAGVSALAGKTVVALAAGGLHNLALCSDGTVVAWGYNYSGQLGDNTKTNRSVPVAVNTAAGASALSGKAVVAMATGGASNLVLCSDGTLAAWGSNSSGLLGDGTTTSRSVPVAVNTAAGVSALFDKAVVAVASGINHGVALCSDGTLAAWGDNSSGQLGDTTTTDRSVPVVVKTTSLATGERFTRVIGAASANHTIALVAGSYAPAIDITGNDTAIPAGGSTPSIANHTDFGSTSVGGGTITRTFTIRNTGNLPLNLTGTPKVVVAGAQAGEFTVTNEPESPVAVGASMTFQVTFTPGATFLRAATLSIASDAPDENPYAFAIQGNGTGALNATFAAGGEVPLTCRGGIATGSTVNFTLSLAVPTGTNLTVVNNMGLGFIGGTFDNLAQGQKVELRHGGITYEFVADYYGGSGNDLVLVWGNQRIFAWGSNSSGQLGDTTTSNRSEPVAVNTAAGVSALSGKTVVALAAGRSHSLALCSDGTVVAWGNNSKGQLGDNTTTGSSVPVAVNTSAGVSALAGKTVVSVAAGTSHSLALCSDGTVAAWGDNSSGQLGDGTSLNTRSVPVAVNTTAGQSALAGKKVVAVACGSHSLVLCSDGTVVAWGPNSTGPLGDGTTTNRSVPVAVNTTAGVSILSGKTVVAVAAGGFHSLALCSDGTLAAWGSNSSGQIGDKGTSLRSVPVAVNTAAGTSELSGKTVAAVAAGFSHSLALCSDGTVAAWGDNYFGQLGDGTTTDRSVPVAVSMAAGVSSLSGKTVVAATADHSHCLALCSDGTVAAWGNNSSGQLGDNTTANRSVPVAINPTPLAFGEGFPRLMGKSKGNHTLALVAMPLPALPTWRLAHFGSGIDSGDGADLNDFDQDGLPNLLEFAFGLDPKQNSAGQIPAPQWVGGDLVISFTQPAGVSGISYGAEWSETLEPGSWTAVPDSGNQGASPPQHTFGVPVGTKTGVYLRLKVTRP